MKKFVLKINSKLAGRLKTKEKQENVSKDSENFSAEQLREARQLFVELTAARFS